MPSAFWILTPPSARDARLAIAAALAGEIGIFDLGWDPAGPSQIAAVAALRQQADSDRWGIRVEALAASPDPLQTLRALDLGGKIPLLVLAGLANDESRLAALCGAARELADRVYFEVYRLAEAEAAQRAGGAGVLIKGNEAAGRVSQDSSFLLLQQLHGRLQIPYVIQGGIGPDTAAAALLSGAAGVVLREQVWLTREAPFDDADRRRFAALDGSETTTVSAGSETYRFSSRTARSAIARIESLIAAGQGCVESVATVVAEAAAHGSASQAQGEPASNGHAHVEHAHETLLPLGQEIALAAQLATRHTTVAGLLQGMRRRIASDLHLAERQQALAPRAPLAQAHRVEFPILQGPMTRVSDVAPFCRSVADNGALPFLALALLRGPEVQKLLTETRDLMAERPWGVGILGFVPVELRKEQLEVVRDIRPPYAIIAGGRPSQAAQLEELGICTYLHVPSPGLLASFLADGARKFIFEGRECGGHVGPRSSFTLWQSTIDLLLEADLARPEEVHVVFAGGIHDALSSAMVAVLAAPLVARGMKVGILMGTAYLFTTEGVASGAITAEFQRQALECRETILLESGIGHATRCVPSPFAGEFLSAKHELMRDGKSSDQIRLHLEMLNIGRLRLAAKGIDRRAAAAGNGKGELFQVDATAQRDRGMFMIGQVAALRDRVVSMAELHAEVTTGSQECLERLAGQRCPWQSERPQVKREDQDIAIVGIGCMFPESTDVRSYWQNIVRGFNAIREVPESRWRPEDFYSADRSAPDKVNSKWGAFLSDVVFDPLKYVIPPASLASIEPVQLLALEVAWQALEDAGYHGHEFSGERTAVIFGVSPMHDRGAEYAFRTMIRHFMPRVEWLSTDQRQRIFDSLEAQLPVWTEDSFAGYLPNVIAGRVSNRLNLRGANFAVDAACAASLAALHAAAQELRTHSCDVAVAGAADGTNNPFAFMSFAKTHALTSTGQPRPFDDRADGIALGEGVAALVLKRLVDAEREGDRIYAVIKGIGTSSDGRNRSLTAPHPQGQMSALERAYEDAGFDPKTVSLVEAHGTGTAVGDRIEIQALQSVFSAHGSGRQSCGIGSVKSMIGHTKTAAGMASLIKTALALKHRLLPPTLGVTVPNREIDFAASPFYINSEARPWIDTNGAAVRRAGLSAFGFGGTNFHVVLEEYTGQCHPRHEFDLAPREAELFVWRRGEPQQLLAALDALREELSTTEDLDLAALGHALLVDEATLAAPASGGCRLAIVATSLADLREKLELAIAQVGKAAAGSIAAGSVAACSAAASSVTVNNPIGIYYSAATAVASDAVCFLFPGQGSQSVNMLRDLALCAAELPETLAEADEVLADLLPQPLSRYVYPVPVFDPAAKAQLTEQLNDTRIAQPAMGVTGLAGAKILERFGLSPAAVAGHSYGEYVALCVAGAFSAADLFRLSAQRGQVVHESTESTPGAMAAVMADGETTAKTLQSMGLSLLPANLNSPEQTIIAGPVAEIEAAVKSMTAAGLRAKKIPVTGAFHTPAMDEAAKKFATHLDAVAFQPLRLPVWSNTTAAPYPADAAEARQQLASHLTSPVLFEKQIRGLHAAGMRVFLEVGAGAVLTGLVGRILGSQPHTAVSLDAPGRGGSLQLAHLLAQCLALGLPVDVAAWFAGRRLPKFGVAKLCAEARQQKVRRPTDWLVNGGQARPWAQSPAAIVPIPTVVSPGIVSPSVVSRGVPERTTDDATAAASANNLLRNTTPPIAPAMAGPTFHETSMSAHEALNGDRSTGQTLPPSAAASAALPPGAALVPAMAQSSPVALQALAYFQTSMAHWLELQKSQQTTNQQFLLTQEKVLLAFMQGASGATTTTLESAPRLMAPLPPAAAGPSPGLRVAPAPVVAANRSAPAVAPQATVPQTSARVPSPVAPLKPVVALHADAPTNGAAGNGTAGNGATNRHGRVALAPAVAPAPAPAASAAPSGPPPTEQFRRDLLETVTLRTGYPPEMLNESLPLEAGLGIDSIKTLEIFNALKQYHPYFRDDDQQDQDDVLVEFAQLKTLGKIVDAYDLKRQRFVNPGTNGKAAAAAHHDNASGPAAVVERFELAAVATPLAAEAREKKNSLTGTPS